MSFFLRMLVCVVALGGIVRAADGATSFTGHYELKGSQEDRAFVLDVTQVGDKADISFSAAMADGSGAAPDADGSGKMKGAVLTFTFKDSFDNEGTGTLELGKTGYHLKLDATKVAEPRCLRFYGDLILKKTSNKPQQ